MDQLALHRYWAVANQKMVGKILSEFAYEQAFQFEPTAQGYQLNLENGTRYCFAGEENIWGRS